MCSFLPIASPAQALPGNPLPAAWRLRSSHSAGKPGALRIVLALRGGGETPPRPHFGKSVIRRSHRQRVPGLRDSFAGPRLGFAERRVARAESRPSCASLRAGRGRGVGGGSRVGHSRVGAEALGGGECTAFWKPRCGGGEGGGLPRQPGAGGAASAGRAAGGRAAATEHARRWPRAAPGFQNEIPPLRVLAAAKRGRRSASVLWGALERKGLAKTWG